jgi:calcineurin-like phosphoesterase family protein
MANWFFTADPHYGHENIIKHSGRPFSCAEEMDETMIENWNRDVESSRDKIIVLGDFTFYSKVLIQDPKSVFNRLKGEKYLIIGNHDRKPTMDLPWSWVKDVFFLKGLNQTGIWLSHYAHRSWRNSFHGSWHLWGHTHGKLPPYGLSFDCGVDSNDFCLWHIDDVSVKMKTLSEELVI